MGERLTLREAIDRSATATLAHRAALQHTKDQLRKQGESPSHYSQRDLALRAHAYLEGAPRSTGRGGGPDRRPLAGAQALGAMDTSSSASCGALFYCLCALRVP
jgi:hypothetical protein